jgi:hypothetical protein
MEEYRKREQLRRTDPKAYAAIVASEKEGTLTYHFIKYLLSITSHFFLNREWSCAQLLAFLTVKPALVMQRRLARPRSPRLSHCVVVQILKTPPRLPLLLQHPPSHRLS